MRIEWSPNAMADRERNFDFIVNDSPSAALAVDERVAAVEAQLARFPQSGRKGRVQNTRELIVQHTPYIVVYELRSDVVVILAIIHGAQQWPPADRV